MSSTDCIFCKIVAGQIPCYKILKMMRFWHFWISNPISDGHTIVIPKVHYERVDQCPAEILAETAKTLGHLAKAVTSAVTAPAFNVLCNNGSPAGQVVKHIHFFILFQGGKMTKSLHNGQSILIRTGKLLNS